jgi:hypothetical protein
LLRRLVCKLREWFAREGSQEIVELTGQVVGLKVQVQVLLREVVGGQGCNFIDCNAKRWDELADWELLDIVLDAIGCAACDAKRLFEEFLFTLCYLSALALYHCLCGSPGDSCLACDPVDLSALSRQVHYCSVLGPRYALACILAFGLD